MARARSTAAEGKKVQLTAQDWADAALAAMREKRTGLAAIAVEPLAIRLGATKGSFYWHFADREALVDATLERWAERDTEAVIASVADRPDPEDRLRTLFVQSIAESAEDPVELALLAHAHHPKVAAILERVTDRRLAYLAELLGELGFDADTARRRALLGYSGYLGHTQLALSVPGALPRGREHERYIDTVMTMLLRA